MTQVLREALDHLEVAQAGTVDLEEYPCEPGTRGGAAEGHHGQAALVTSIDTATRDRLETYQVREGHEEVQSRSQGVLRERYPFGVARQHDGMVQEPSEDLSFSLSRLSSPSPLLSPISSLLSPPSSPLLSLSLSHSLSLSLSLALSL